MANGCGNRVWEDAVRLRTTGERCAGGAVLDGVRLVSSSALSPLAYLGNLERLASWISLHSRGSDRCHHRPPRKLCSWVHTLLRLLLRPSGEAPTPHSGQGPRAPPKCQAPLCSLTCHQVGKLLVVGPQHGTGPQGRPLGPEPNARENGKPPCSKE